MRVLSRFGRAVLIAALGATIPFAAACSSGSSSGETAQVMIEIVKLTINPASKRTIQVGGQQEYTLEVQLRIGDGDTETYSTEDLADLDAAVDDAKLTQAQADAILAAVGSLAWASSDSDVASLKASADGSAATAKGVSPGEVTVSVSYATDSDAISASVDLAVEAKGGTGNGDQDGGLPGASDAGAGAAGNPGGSGGSGRGGGGSGTGASSAGGAGGTSGTGGNSGTGGAASATPGVTVDAPADGLSTTEKGGQDQFTVALDSAPSSTVTVTIGIASDEAVASPTSLKFTKDDWAAPKQVTVTGADDDEADGDQEYIVSLKLASQDAAYDELAVDGVKGVNLDDESASIVITQPENLETTEGGGIATFEVSLAKAPTALVQVPIGTESGEVSLDVVSLTFTPENFDSPQTVTLTGADDDVLDGDQEFSVLVGPATSDDDAYNGAVGADVLGLNLDDEQAGAVLSDHEELFTSEGGDQAVFQIKLLSKPTSTVTFALSSSDPGEGTVSPAKLSFTPENFNAPQTVTATGVDDNVSDGDQLYSIITGEAESTDPAYSGLEIIDIEVTNLDNDSAGFSISPASIVVDEDGAAASVTVSLRSKPAAAVVLAVSSSDEGEATVAPATLTFTPDNWNSTKTLQVTGVDDFAADGDQPFLVVFGAATSTDPDYAGLNPRDVPGVNEDKDSPGLAIAPGITLTVSEDGEVTDSLAVALDSAPSANVVVSVVVSDPSEAAVDLPQLTFTPNNWNGIQTVQVRGVDDNSPDGDQPFTVTLSVAMSDDAGYLGVTQVVPGTNLDVGDSPGILLDAAENLTTYESPTKPSATFTVRLASEPNADVTIPLTISSTEGTLSTNSLVFTGGAAGNWNVPHTVTVTGVDDSVNDGDQEYRVRLEPAVSADPEYEGMDGPDVTLTNVDNDSPGLVLLWDFQTLVTTENQAVGAPIRSFQLALASKPSADVMVTIQVEDQNPCELLSPGQFVANVVPQTCVPEVAFALEGDPSQVIYTFTPVNWDDPQTVSVRGLDDDFQDGHQPASISFTAVTSADADYNRIVPASLRKVKVINSDFGDTARVGLTAEHCPSAEAQTVNMTTNESGTPPVCVRVLLETRPTATVTVPLLISGADQTEATFTNPETDNPDTFTTSVVFPVAGTLWSTGQVVHIWGIDDDEEDGTQSFQVAVGSVTGASEYAALTTPTGIDGPVTFQNANECAAGAVGDIACRTSSGGSCSDGEGSYSCGSCGDGYAITSGGTGCEDIDECDEAGVGDVACRVENGGSCLNSAGSYACVSCGNGYAVSSDGFSCEDVDECAEGAAGDVACGVSNGGSCTNNAGSYACDSCADGYSVSTGGLTCEASCPGSTDVDNDGICDDEDICPSGDNEADADEDGTPDACDACPNDPVLSTFNWIVWDTPLTSPATGTVGGVGVTFASSAGISSTESMFGHSNFPPSYDVPLAGPTIQNINVSSNTLTFDREVSDPLLVFSSVGNGSTAVPVNFGSNISIEWSQAVTSFTENSFVGQEGYAVVRVPGVHTSITFNYTTAENYANFAFGFGGTNADTDEDGVPDVCDSCPADYGDTDNGCPPD